MAASCCFGAPCALIHRLSKSLFLRVVVSNALRVLSRCGLALLALHWIPWRVAFGSFQALLFSHCCAPTLLYPSRNTLHVHTYVRVSQSDHPRTSVNCIPLLPASRSRSAVIICMRRVRSVLPLKLNAIDSGASCGSYRRLFLLYAARIASVRILVLLRGLACADFTLSYSVFRFASIFTRPSCSACWACVTVNFRRNTHNHYLLPFMSCRKAVHLHRTSAPFRRDFPHVYIALNYATILLNNLPVYAPLGPASFCLHTLLG